MAEAHQDHVRAPSRQFACPACAGVLQWDGSANALSCQHCGHNRTVPADGAASAVRELRAFLASQVETHAIEQRRALSCGACGAGIMAPGRTTALKCPFCAAPIVARPQTHAVIEPSGVLPFKVDRAEARELFYAWLKQCRFVPADMREKARVDNDLRGVYLPCWLFSCAVSTTYRCERRTALDPTVRRQPVQMKKTEVVDDRLDHVRVMASRALPADELHALEPWDTANVVPYRPDYLSGFEAESYELDVAEGFLAAQAHIDRELAWRHDVHDRQDFWTSRPESTRIGAVEFDHILVPVWISAYRYQGRVYRFLVNARTGRVHADRPLSSWKVFGAGLAAMIGVSILAWPLFSLGHSAGQAIEPHAVALKDTLTADKPAMRPPTQPVAPPIHIDSEMIHRHLENNFRRHQRELRERLQSGQLERELLEHIRHDSTNRNKH